MDLISLLGTAVGVAGLAFALYENRQRARITDHMRLTSWSSYQRVDTATGHVQAAKAKYLDKHKQAIDPEVLDLLARADAFSQEVFKETIRQISYTEPSFRAKDFERWKKEGKLADDKVALFMKFAVDPELK